MGFPGGSDSEESACNVGGPGLMSGLGRSSGEVNGYPLPGNFLGSAYKDPGIRFKSIYISILDSKKKK